MSEQPQPQGEYERLRALAELREQPFTSNVPLLGGLIVWFRTAWNNVSTRWYVRPMADQQSSFNASIVDKLQQDESRLQAELATIQATLTSVQSMLAQVDGRLVDQDRDQVNTVHDLGELSVQVTALRGVVEALEARLAELESDRD